MRAVPNNLCHPVAGGHATIGDETMQGEERDVSLCLLGILTMYKERVQVSVHVFLVIHSIFPVRHPPGHAAAPEAWQRAKWLALVTSPVGSEGIASMASAELFRYVTWHCLSFAFGTNT